VDVEGAPPSISVVLCTYNGEEFIEEQLRSILNQTLMPQEIIVSDDGSTDSTLSRVEGIAHASPKDIRWDIRTRAAPLGAAENFGSALPLATGDFIALSDQDDVWAADKLEVMSQRLSENPSLLLIHSDARLIDAEGAPGASLMSTLRITRGERNNLARGFAIKALLRRNLVTGATVVLRKELLDDALPLPQSWVHDEWLGLIAALRGGLAFNARALIDYRQHGNNQIGANKTDVAMAQSRLKETRQSFFAKKAMRNEALSNLVDTPPPWLTPEGLTLLAGKTQHDAWRRTLPALRIRRIIPVLLRGLAGNYAKYSRGVLDMVRDVSLCD
jgi:glycosyltransferase involved in cell wall biosynthesis